MSEIKDRYYGSSDELEILESAERQAMISDKFRTDEFDEDRPRYSFNEEDHIHTLGGRPLIGTTTSLGIISKPLTWWASGKAVEKLGWTNSKIRVNGKYVTIPDEKRLPVAEETLKKLQEMPTAEYLKLLDEAYKAHDAVKNEAAEEGTDLHELLEQYIKGCIHFGGKPMVSEHANTKVKAFADWAVLNVKKFLFSEAYCYSENLWLGGICDAAAELLDGKNVVIDFKSAKEAYMSHFLQCALYDYQLSENGAFTKDGEKIMDTPIFDGYMVVPFGAKEFTVSPMWSTYETKEAAIHAVQLYKFSLKF